MRCAAGGRLGSQPCFRAKYCPHFVLVRPHRKVHAPGHPVDRTTNRSIGGRCASQCDINAPQIRRQFAGSPTTTTGVGDGPLWCSGDVRADADRPLISADAGGLIVSNTPMDRGYPPARRSSRHRVRERSGGHGCGPRGTPDTVPGSWGERGEQSGEPFFDIHRLHVLRFHRAPKGLRRHVDQARTLIGAHLRA
jgi:hypothetical protein